MALTYKIRPLVWNEFVYKCDNALKARKYNYLIYFDRDCDWLAIFSDTEYDAFITLDEAKAWVEEKHTAKVREYLEALE